MCPILDETIVATCDDEIKQVVLAAGGTVIMTANTHKRCTDRIAEAAAKIDADVIINVQGDEPLVMPEMITEITKPFFDDPELLTVNLVTRIVDDEEFQNSNVPKVVTNRMGDILYISREPIPSSKIADTYNYVKLKQLGLIAFRSDFLQVFTRLEPTPHEIIESVDMMRAIEHGYRVKAVEIKGQMIGVDVPEDIKRVEKFLVSDPLIEKIPPNANVNP